MKKRSVSFWAGSVALAAAFGTPLLAFAQEKFVSLSGIPAFQNAGDASNLPQFLNQLYLICIGVAVVITVLQLIRAGIMYSMGDSGFAKIEEAKHLISISLLGLLLVLSPYIVFNIINPKILSLKIDTSGIQVKDDGAAADTPGGHGTTQDLQNLTDRNNAALTSATLLKTYSDQDSANANCTPAKTGYVSGVGGGQDHGGVTGSGGTPVFVSPTADGNYGCYRNQGVVVDSSTCGSSWVTDIKSACAAAQNNSQVNTLDPLTCSSTDPQTGAACRQAHAQAAAGCSPENASCREVSQYACEDSGKEFTAFQATNGGPWTISCE